ncbi:hypothetical protein AAG906_001038 [Vitis piasezkii]
MTPIRRGAKWRWQPRLSRPVVIWMRMCRRDPPAKMLRPRIGTKSPSSPHRGNSLMMRLAPPLALLATRSWKTS